MRVGETSKAVAPRMRRPYGFGPIKIEAFAGAGKVKTHGVTGDDMGDLIAYDELTGSARMRT